MQRSYDCQQSVVSINPIFTLDTLVLIGKFQENRNQLDGLMTLVEATTNAESAVIKKNADKFVEDYGAYTPKVSTVKRASV